MMDGPLAPFGDADRLRDLMAQDVNHRELYRVFLDVRDAAARILENTSLADIVNAQKPPRPKSHKRHSAKKHDRKEA